MTHSLFVSVLAAALQLAVPSYALRLNRLFGSRKVGWALVLAFLGLALLNLTAGLGSAGARPEWELAFGIAGGVIPVLLLIGLAHVGTLLRERARVEEQERMRNAELTEFLERRTEELDEAREAFRREIGHKDQELRAFAGKAQQERLELGTQMAARAGQHLTRHLTVVDLYARLLRGRHPAPGSARHLERLSAEAAQARALAERLLACGCCRFPRPQLLSLSDVVRQYQPALQGLLGAERLLECVCPADAPLVWADPQLVRRMLEELVRNARDAMPEAGCVRIAVERAAAGAVGIHVTDTGRGMSREVQKRAGEPFFTTKPGTHAGLGLASVLGLIRAHDGWLKVTSALGHGTTVRLFFRQAHVPAASEAS